jgi:sugar/nucleoside kinase (ribokinase family)
VVEVGCAGLLVEDTFCGPLTALPAEGALAILSDMPVRSGGCAANVAIDLVRQGISVDVAGCVGRDAAGELLVSSLASCKIGVRHIRAVDGHRTSKTVIVLIEGQDRRYIHVQGANKALAVEHLSEEWLSGLKVLYLGGLFGLPGIDLDKLRGVLEFCRREQIASVVDVVVPQGTHGMAPLKPLLPLIDVFVPNDDEASAFTGRTDPIDQLRCFQSAGAQTVIITRGNQGVAAVQGDRTWACGAYRMNVVDPSGSGDAFTSGVIRSLLLGWDMPRTLQYASAIGASATRATGTTDSVFSAAEAEAYIRDNPITVINGR